MVAEEEEVGDWSNVPYHMVELIMNKLMSHPAEISDYVRCGAVCMSWRTVFFYHHHHPPPGTPSITLPPLLIVPTPSSSSSSAKKNKIKKKTVLRHNYSNKKKKNKKKKKKRRVKFNIKTFSFYNIIDKKVYNQFHVTIPRNRYFRGSSHGWLVAVDQHYDTCQVRLFNPFMSYSSFSSGVINNANNNKGEILLPPLKHLPILFEDYFDNHDVDYGYPDEYFDNHDVRYGYPNRNTPSSYAYLKKAVLSADPLSSPIDYIVMAIFGSPGRLAYCRPGGNRHDKVWTLVEFEYNKYWGFRDVIYCKGRFFALYYPGIVVVLDPTQNMMAVTLKVPLPQYQLLPRYAMYLVEYAGSLLQVYRELEIGPEDTITGRLPYSTTKFRVFEFCSNKTKEMNYDFAKVNHDHHQEQEEGEWKWLKNLCGCTLFLGENHSMWIRASDYPGCKPNSIYFTDDYIDMYYSEPWDGPHDLGVFNLVDDTIENHYPTDHSTPIRPTPIWIQPTVLAAIDLDPKPIWIQPTVLAAIDLDPNFDSSV